MNRDIPRILAISDRHLLGRSRLGGDAMGTPGGPEDWLEVWMRGLATDGVEAVQLREKDLSDRQLYELLRRAVMLGRELGLEVLVNGRADLALAAGADGVHLPAAEVSALRLRRRFGNRLRIGRSTHCLAEVERARREGADYVTFGPVFDTPSKRPYGEPPGLEGLEQAVAVGLPVLALGGVDADRVARVAETGAAGVAAIRALAEPATRRRLVAARRRAWPVVDPERSVGG